MDLFHRNVFKITILFNTHIYLLQLIFLSRIIYLNGLWMHCLVSLTSFNEPAERLNPISLNEVTLLSYKVISSPSLITTSWCGHIWWQGQLHWSAGSTARFIWLGFKKFMSSAFLDVVVETSQKAEYLNNDSPMGNIFWVISLKDTQEIVKTQ